MNYGEIKKNDIANGLGVRTTLFVSGCTHHCKGCFQPQTWDFCFGKPYTKEVEDGILDSLSPYYIAGLTLLGDALKAVVACLFGYALFGQLGAYMAGMACVVGHVFPIYYGFKGGKGVLVTATMALILTPVPFVILLAIFALVVYLSKYVSLGSVTVACLYPVVVYGHYKVIFPASAATSGVMMLILILLATLIVYCHRENLKRISNGTERKISIGGKKKKDE
jgi:acyl-phosphate glycerol 3-phosphate acyltransferase